MGRESSLWSTLLVENRYDPKTAKMTFEDGMNFAFAITPSVGMISDSQPEELQLDSSIGTLRAYTVMTGF